MEVESPPPSMPIPAQPSQPSLSPSFFFGLLSLYTLPFSLFLFVKLFVGSVNLALGNCNLLLLFVSLFNG